MSGLDEAKAKADALKDAGNKLLAQIKYAAAAEKYTEAIAIFPSAILYSNRAQALINIESYGAAILDANEALQIDDSYMKAYFRRGSANFALSKFKLAKADFKKVWDQIQDPEALKRYKECDKRIKVSP
jgi:serine/threonine-protein phosphatase 5